MGFSTHELLKRIYDAAIGVWDEANGRLKATAEPAAATKSWAQQATTDAYARLDSPWDKSKHLTTTVFISNTGANGAHVKVLGSVDGGANYDIEILAETVVAAVDSVAVKFGDYYTHIDIQIKAQTAASQTTVLARGASIAA